VTIDLLIVLIAIAAFGFAFWSLWSFGRREAHRDAEHVRKPNNARRSGEGKA
jgi:hypothetical protein